MLQPRARNARDAHLSCFHSLGPRAPSPERAPPNPPALLEYLEQWSREAHTGWWNKWVHESTPRRLSGATPSFPTWFSSFPLMFSPPSPLLPAHPSSQLHFRSFPLLSPSQNCLWQPGSLGREPAWPTLGDLSSGQRGLSRRAPSPAQPGDPGMCPSQTRPITAGLPTAQWVHVLISWGLGWDIEQGWSPSQEEHKWSKLYSIFQYFFSGKFKHINRKTYLNKIL